VLTASQTVMGVAIILALRFHRWSALALVAVFAVQFVVTETAGRYLLSAAQLLIAAAVLVIHRNEVLPTLTAPFRRTPAPARAEEAHREPAGAGTRR
jgi:cation:H+ antiporter